MALNTSRADKKAGSPIRTRIIVITAIILFICLLAFYWGGRKPSKENKTMTQRKADSGLVEQKGPGATGAVPVEDTASAGHHKVDTAISNPVVKRHPYPGYAAGKTKAKAAADSAKAFQASADSAKKALAAADSVKAATAAVDSAKTAKAADTGVIDSDALFFGSNAPADCANDTVVPWVYPEPSGGLYHGPLSVRFVSNKKCSISWRTGPDTIWQRYADKALPIDKTMMIFFKAVDRCGHEMKIRQEYYEIELSGSANICPQGMDLVKIGSMRFCIDRYEWPNRKGIVPQSYVTLYQAKDSCFAAGKRLCTSEEWSLACSGPYSWKYPYGQDYEPRACITTDTVARPSGSKPECRSFFGSFDMSGNLLEWTGTVSRGNPGFYNVLGGFWQSGVRSSCFDIRSSYFPQNRQNPVGFRCCKDAPEGK